MFNARSNRSLYRMVRAIVGQYGLSDVRLRLLSKTEHRLFQVDATTASGAVERFSLRLYEPSVFDAASVQTEVEWLSALAGDAGLLVPEPVALPDNRVVLYSSPEASNTRYASVLFRWVSGRRRKASLSPVSMEQVGQFVGRLHAHAERFQPSVGRSGQQWSWERVFGAPSIVGFDPPHSLLSPEQQGMFQSIARGLREAMDELGRAPDVWGLIHGDLHTSNYLFHHDAVGAIDFEDCGWGWFVYDLAVVLDEVYAVYPDRAEELRSALLRGYHLVRALPEKQARHLDLFVAMRLAELVRWYGTSAHEQHQASAAKVAAEAITFVKQRRLFE